MCCVVLLASCSKRDGNGRDSDDRPMTDGWELVSWNNSTAIAGHVYLQFDTDRFTLYQQIGTLVAGYTQYTGTYAFEEDPLYGTLLTGSYSDGTSWLRRYVVEERTEEELRLRSLDEGIVSIYKSVVIPAYVREEPVDPSSRGAAPAEEPFL